MLLNDLYSINDISIDNNKLSAQVVINAEHKTFEGHFPNQPILPGVCLLEMMKDIFSGAFNKEYSISEANNIKYLSVVDPRVNTILNFEISFEESNDALKVSALSRMGEEVVNFKFKGLLQANA